MKGLIRKSMPAAAICLVLLGRREATAQDFAMVSADPAEQVMKFKGQDGRIHVVDNRTRSIYLSGTDGNVYEVSFLQAADQLTNTAAERDALVLKLRRALRDYSSLGTLTGSSIPRRATTYEPPGGPGDWVKPQRIRSVL